MSRRKTEKHNTDGPFAGRYHIQRELGRGGGGVVYLAEDLRQAGSLVALKILDLQDHDPSLATALENEFRTLSALRHRHLARVLDFGSSKFTLHVSSEFIVGMDLLEATREADLNTVFRLVVETLRALDYLHKRGVLHLDLKPPNILVTDPSGQGEPSVRLIDFGIAQWKRHGVESKGGEFSGTAPYAAPEQILGQALSPATDLYSLSMILHLLFTKSFPFPTQDPMQMMQVQIYKEADPPKHLHEALPESFAELLQRSVARDPQRRFASAQAMLQAINASLDEKFSLRDAKAPASVLEESDFNFRNDNFNALLQTAEEGKSSRTAVVGPKGSGKSRLLLRLKETLQLHGKHPLHFTEIPNEKLLSSSEPGALILDFSNARSILGTLSAYPAPIFWAADPETHLPSDFKREVLFPLDTKILSEFLHSEVADFPIAAGTPLLAEQCEGRADHFASLLQSLRDEGSLSWGEAGWRWSGGSVEALKNLDERRETRSRQRLSQVLELLRLSPLGLSTASLAGMLGMDREILETQLRAWQESGVVSLREHAGILRLAPESPDAGLHATSRNWSELQSELESHYNNGDFHLGTSLIDLISQNEKNLSDLPSEIRILGSRHYAAAGQNDKALAFLPRSAPKADRWAGLFWEIRTRCEVSLGKAESARDSLGPAAEHYGAAQDFSGMARCSNLAGWIAKKLGQNEEACRAYERAIEFAQGCGDFYAQGLAEMNLGTVFHDQGRLEIAGQYYEKALNSAEQAGHPLLQIKLNQNRINLYYTMGRSSEAEAGCYELLRLALRHSFPEEQAAALNFLSLIAGQRGDTVTQRRYLDQAIATLTERPHCSLLPQLYFNRAHLLWSDEKFPASQLDAEASLAAAKKQSNSFLSAWSELLLGKILRDRRKPDLAGAKQHLETARRQMKEQNLKHLMWEVEFDLGLLAKQSKDLPSAAGHFQAAKKDLESVLPELPESLRQSYLRDRKLERISEELNNL